MLLLHQNYLTNEAYIRQISNESDKINMAPKQTTLPHPLSTPSKHPHRYYINQKTTGMVHRAASFGREKPHKTIHQVGRQHSFQVPNRPSAGNINLLKFNPTTPIAINANIRGSMTPMAKPILSMTPSKGMTYSLDRRQAQENSRPRSQKEPAFYQNINSKWFFSKTKFVNFISY